jgi:hypothetical protein
MTRTATAITGIFGLALAFLLTAAIGTGICAQQKGTATANIATVAGTIYFVDRNGAVTIVPPKEKIEAAPRAVILANGQTRITRDQKPATVANLKEGDSVQAEYIPATGAAIAIRATSR